MKIKIKKSVLLQTVRQILKQREWYQQQRQSSPYKQKIKKLPLGYVAKKYPGIFDIFQQYGDKEINSPQAQQARENNKLLLKSEKGEIHTVEFYTVPGDTTYPIYMSYYDQKGKLDLNYVWDLQRNDFNSLQPGRWSAEDPQNSIQHFMDNPGIQAVPLNPNKNKNIDRLNPNKDEDPFNPNAEEDTIDDPSGLKQYFDYLNSLDDQDGPNLEDNLK